ncbi:MAG: hypothetical protein ACHQDY_03690 [Solirubrobacterales bacterium]
MARALALNPLEPLLRRALRRLNQTPAPRQWEALAPALRLSALRSGKFSITNL